MGKYVGEDKQTVGLVQVVGQGGLRVPVVFVLEGMEDMDGVKDAKNTKDKEGRMGVTAGKWIGPAGWGMVTSGRAGQGKHSGE